jgi:hypothetical protein
MLQLRTLLLASVLAALPAGAANELFFKENPGSMNGFLAATDPTYVKECGACHFAYSPGLLPARSWELHMTRLERHFGESVVLSDTAKAAVAKYLTENAADRSPYNGSKVMMERLPANQTPYRFMDLPLYREMHRIMLEVISIKTRVKVRTLTNCNACHQWAPEGSFGNSELLIPGLTPSRR